MCYTYVCMHIRLYHNLLKYKSSAKRSNLNHLNSCTPNKNGFTKLKWFIFIPRCLCRRCINLTLLFTHNFSEKNSKILFLRKNSSLELKLYIIMLLLIVYIIFLSIISLEISSNRVPLVNFFSSLIKLIYSLKKKKKYYVLS